MPSEPTKAPSAATESHEERTERWIKWASLPYHFVPLSLYDEYQKLSEYAVGEMLTEIGQLRDRVRQLGGSFDDE